MKNRLLFSFFLLFFSSQSNAMLSRAATIATPKIKKSIANTNEESPQDYAEKFDNLVDAIQERDTEENIKYQLINDFIDDPNFIINFQNKDGKTLLFIVGELGFFDLFNTLLDQGANILLTPKTKQNILHYAAQKKINKPINEFLKLIKNQRVIEKQVNERDNFGNTPLYYAVSRQDLTDVKELLNAKANPNLANKDGFTPLHRAIALQSPELIKALLDKGANPLIKTTKKISKKQYNSATKAYEVVEIKEEAVDSPLTMAQKIAKSSLAYASIVKGNNETISKNILNALEEASLKKFQPPTTAPQRSTRRLTSIGSASELRKQYEEAIKQQQESSAQKAKKRVSWSSEQKLEQIKLIPSRKEQQQEELKFELLELHQKLVDLNLQL